MDISLRTTVGELAAAIPHATRIFEKHRIDYCCGGRRSLAEACERSGTDPSVIVAALSTPPRATDPSTDWRKAPVDVLVRHILDVHHVYMWEELPRLNALMTKVARVHGDRHPELRQLEPVVLGLLDELRTHLTKEERILFPYVLSLCGTAPGVDACFATAAGPIRVMDAEHEDAGEALAVIRRLSGDLTPPDDACGSYRALYQGLAEMEQDLHLHIHLETNVLFPRVLELEAASRAD
ncbi:MAG: iron-sulfur cluster repair di-iron protein [Sandaracinus sp.]|nr:iron-sulfur cluster repair di-iron protein [Sandaracinus sp.]MCB9622843.1 iron-sulfur cluster repair di-iron protein [Sandaracinus sp.]